VKKEAYRRDGVQAHIAWRVAGKANDGFELSDEVDVPRAPPWTRRRVVVPARAVQIIGIGTDGIRPVT